MPRNFCSPFFLATQFSLFLISQIGSNNITVSNNKNIQKVICASEIVLLSHPKHHNFKNDLLIHVHLSEKVSAPVGYSGNFLTFLQPLI